MKLLRPIERDLRSEILPGFWVTPTCAGHILGSTSLLIETGGRRVTFSGDIGRYDTPILPDPQPAEIGDLLLCESTYGDRLHADTNVRSELAAMVHKVIDRKGPLIIPFFAVGRTQNLLYFLGELEREGRIPEIPVFVDSPMAVDATQIYRSFRHDYDEEASEIIRAGDRPLSTAKTELCRSANESKNLNFLKGPRIIISASGMVTGGRILHHMKNWLPQEESTVAFVGYQAEGTRGRLIQSGIKELKIFGQMVPVRAHIETISGLSAHGDRNELFRWLKSCRSSPSLVRVVHGEEESSRNFAASLRREMSWNAASAEYGETVEV